jgi:hypothetical protein
MVTIAGAKTKNRTRRTIDLIVVKSTLYVPGVARVHESVPSQLDIPEGSFVEIYSSATDTKVIAKLQIDSIVYEYELALAQKDLERLNVEEGDVVSVQPHGGFKWFRRFRLKR